MKRIFVFIHTFIAAIVPFLLGGSIGKLINSLLGNPPVTVHPEWIYMIIGYSLITAIKECMGWN